MTLQDVLQFTVWQIDDDQSLLVADIVAALLFTIVGLLAVRYGVRWLGRRLQRQSVGASADPVIERVALYGLSALVLLMALQLLGIPLTMFAVLGGAMAIGIGFGAQNIINNFISGWILMAERRMRIGDLIDVADNHGRVEDIGARSTLVRRTDGIDIIVPNSVMLEGTVINWTLSDKTVRTTVRVGVAYGSPTDRVIDLLRSAVADHASVLTEPEPIVIFEDFGDSALIFDVYFWCHIETRMQLRITRSDVRHRIDASFRSEGIEIAFPQRDVHVREPCPIAVSIATDEDAGHEPT